MRRYAIKMTYRGAVSTWGTLTRPFSLSPSLSRALSLAFRGRWRWCESRQMGLAARQQAVVLCVCFWARCIPCAPSPPPPYISNSLSLSVHSRPVLTNWCSTFYDFLPWFPSSTHFTLFHPAPPPPPSLFFLPSAIMAPTLTEAFIKCQLYTGDHTVEEQDTMISWPLKVNMLMGIVGPTVCQLWGLSRI